MARVLKESKVLFRMLAREGSEPRIPERMLLTLIEENEVWQIPTSAEADLEHFSLIGPDNGEEMGEL